MATAVARKPAKLDIDAELEHVKAIEAKLTDANKPVYKGATPSKIFSVPRDPKEDRTFGFHSMREFTKSIIQWSTPGHEGGRDKRLVAMMQKAADGLSETVAADGGFLVPPEFSQEIFRRVYENDLLARCRSYPVAGNTMVFPAVDEQSRVDGSRFGGIQAFWLDEAQQLTRSKPAFRRITLVLKKLAAFAFLTDELISDAMVSTDQYLIDLFSEEIEFQIGASLIRGTGVGKPMGLLNSACLITVAKDSNQATNTLTSTNIVGMWARLWGPSKKNAVWLVNQDITPQLFTLSLPIGTAGIATYMPPGGLSGAPYGTLMGRPVLEIEFCSTLGTLGDIFLADMSQYLVIRKGGVDTQMSIHLKFDFDETAIRAIFRLDGSPWWNTALTPYQGTNTQSPFVTLAARP